MTLKHTILTIVYNKSADVTVPRGFLPNNDVFYP